MEYLWDGVCVLIGVAASILIYKIVTVTSPDDEIKKNREERFFSGSVK